MTNKIHSESSSDTIRLEEGWDKENEDYLIEFMMKCKNKGEEHLIEYDRNIKYYYFFSIPSTVVPLVLSSITAFIPIGSLVYTSAISLSSVGILNGVSSQFNFSKKAELNASFIKKYTDLHDEIDKILIRSKRFREPFDVVLERVSLKYQHLQESE